MKKSELIQLAMQAPCQLHMYIGFCLVKTLIIVQEEQKTLNNPKILLIYF